MAHCSSSLFIQHADRNKATVLTDVGVLGGGEAAVGALRPPQAELEQLELAVGSCGDPVASGVRCNQTGEVHQAQEGRLEELGDNQRAFDADQRDSVIIYHK